MDLSKMHDKKKLMISLQLMLFHQQIMKNVKLKKIFLIIHHYFLADVELDKTNTQLSDLLRGLELRKRAYYVNMPNIVYIIGMK